MAITEVRIFDRDGSSLPDNALGSDGILYAEVAKFQRLRALAWNLEARLGPWNGPCARFREQMSARAEARCLAAYDRYTERCRGIEVCTIRRESQYGGASSVITEIIE